MSARGVTSHRIILPTASSGCMEISGTVSMQAIDNPHPRFREAIVLVYGMFRNMQVEAGHFGLAVHAAMAGNVMQDEPLELAPDVA